MTPLPRHGYYPLLAENARTTHQLAGSCETCGRAIAPGQRCADLAGREGVIHVACASTTAAP